MNGFEGNCQISDEACVQILFQKFLFREAFACQMRGWIYPLAPVFSQVLTLAGR